MQVMITERDEREAKRYAGEKVWVQASKNGRMSYYHYSYQQMRYFPLRKIVAQLMLQAGSEIQIKQKAVDWICQGSVA